MIFVLFGVQWVMPRGVVDLLACWQGCLKPHRNSEVWKGYPLLLDVVYLEGEE